MKNQNKRKRIQTFLDYSYSLQYKERPVSMKEFLCSDKFFGKLTGNGKMVYPIWMETLDELSREDSKYLVVLTGAIGTGKSRVSIWGIGYAMHRILCLKDPWAFFNKAAGGKMAIVFFNLTKSLGASRGYNLLQSHLIASPWFRERGIPIDTGLVPRVDFPVFEYKLASPYAAGFGTVGSDVILATMDEVDDSSESDKQRIRVLKAYEATVRRFKSRFVFDEESIGKFFLVASKQEQLSFLNTFITQMKNNPSVYIVDIPIWEAKPKADYSGKKFPVKIGDIYVTSEVLAHKDEQGEVCYNAEDVEKAQRDGFKIVWVPVEYYRDFNRDVIGSLRDIAGISVSYLRKSKLFSSEKLLVDCYDSTKKDPVRKLTVEVGIEDDINFINYLDLTAIRIPKNIPRYIHIDIAFSGNGDALGIGMSCAKGWTKDNKEEEDGTYISVKRPIIETDFAMRIKARPGNKIPLNKVRKMIIDLKKVYHFNIALCTFDHRAMSEDSIQILTRAGVKCDYFSVDKDPGIYREFRDLVEDRRWVCHRNEYLHFELINLEEDPERNKIDHPEEVVDIQFLKDGNTQEVVLKGSKDESDGVCGSVHNALKNCETPPDIEFMKEAMRKSITPVDEKKNEYWWVDESSIRVKESLKPKQDSPSKTEISTFKDLFKKSQGEGRKGL